MANDDWEVSDCVPVPSVEAREIVSCAGVVATSVVVVGEPGKVVVVVVVGVLGLSRFGDVWDKLKGSPLANPLPAGAVDRPEASTRQPVVGGLAPEMGGIAFASQVRCCSVPAAVLYSSWVHWALAWDAMVQSDWNSTQ